MTTIKDFEMCLKALGFKDTTPEEYYSDLTTDYTIEYHKDIDNCNINISISDEYIRFTAQKGSQLASKDVKVKVFNKIVEYPIYWTTRMISKLSKEVN